MVIATAVPVAAPAKLQKAASTIAFRGERAREPIEAATALAASLKPLTKPKPMAAAITRTSRAEDSGMLQYYTFKNIGDIFAPVSGIFQVPVDFTPLDYLASVSTTNFEQLD